jgi:hypothetical protein
MLDMKEWIREVRQLSERLRESPEADKESNCLSPASTLEELSDLKSRFPNRDLNQLISFYSQFNGAQFPDLWNGYFFHPINLMLRTREDIPSRVEGTLCRDILQFGSDGGGNLFAVSLEPKPEVLYLPQGSIRKSVYRDSMRPMSILADDFDGFLKRFSEDLRAFVEDTPDWKYMIP